MHPQSSMSPFSRRTFPPSRPGTAGARSGAAQVAAPEAKASVAGSLVDLLAANFARVEAEVLPSACVTGGLFRETRLRELRSELF